MAIDEKTAVPDGTVLKPVELVQVGNDHVVRFTDKNLNRLGLAFSDVRRPGERDDVGKDRIEGAIQPQNFFFF